ncbi:MAG TPA: S1/P1 nuclease [Longimicrobiales bacterium]
MNYLTALLLLLPLQPASSAGAWGEDGHRLVCEIAWRHLTPAAKTMITALRAGETGTFAESCTWADDVGDARPETYNHHFVNIPPRQAGLRMERDCGDPIKRCVTWAIKHYATILADGSQHRTARNEALKFLAHYVGDVHQPLHAGRLADRGGNRVKVSFFGDRGTRERPMQLHGVWDSRILRRAQLRWPQSAAELLREITTTQIAAWTNSDVVGWTNESYRLDEEFVYSVAEGSNIGHVYYTRAVGIARERIQQAGVRLAFLLNEAARGRATFTF